MVNQQETAAHTMEEIRLYSTVDYPVIELFFYVDRLEDTSLYIAFLWLKILKY